MNPTSEETLQSMAQTPPEAPSLSMKSYLWELLLLACALIGRMPALGSWWTLDDWGQIGRAAQVVPMDPGWPARILSQHWWWQLNWPLWGLDPTPQAIARMLLHAGSALLVGRIGRKIGMPTPAWFFAGIVFAVTPLAFTPVYWASGIQELLAVFFALLATERWLQGTRRGMLVALLAAILSFLAKESGFGLPVFWLAILWWGEVIKPEDRAFAWALNLFALLAAVICGVLVVAHFATGPQETYALGGIDVILSNLGIFGWWLLSPGPLLASHITWVMSAAGAVFFILWILWAGFSMPAGNPLPAATLLATLLILGPALPLRTQIHPYLAYLAVAPLGLAFASLIPWSSFSKRWLPLMALPALVWSLFCMNTRLNNRNELGFPADPIVRATSLSWDAANLIKTVSGHAFAAAGDSLTHLVLYQEPIGKTALENARNFGSRWVRSSELYQACGGIVGPTLVTAGISVPHWRNMLTDSSPRSTVLAETATGFKVWGPTANAVLYAAITDVALGYFDRARKHFIAAAALNPATVNFVYDEGQMILPLQLAEQNIQPFIDWTVARLGHGSSRNEIGGIQTMFFQLMSHCTGKSVAQLSRGSKILVPSQDFPIPQKKDDER